MRKSEHRPTTATTDANGAATAPARQPVERAQNLEREGRLAELRRKHADGDYKVDARKLSAKIIDRHLGK